MKRRTLDIAFSAGGLLVAALLLVGGLILTNQSNFAKTYVHNQLSAQRISFTPAKYLSAQEKEAPCLVRYGTIAGEPDRGQLLDSGAKAECYANSYIALHMSEAATAAGYSGETYATMGSFVRAGTAVSLVDVLDKATKSGDQAAIASATKALDSANKLRVTMQTGETLRGLLLTTYGFSIFGERAGQAAYVLYALALLMLVLSIAGFIHAFGSSHPDAKVKLVVE